MLNIDFSISYSSIITFVAAYLIVGYFVMLGLTLHHIANTSYVRGVEDKRKRKAQVRCLYMSALMSWIWPYAIIDTIHVKRSNKKASERYRKQRDEMAEMYG